jgi:Na+-transporting methylmalonyl-CoA/oxaloacetate decarboxylase gamma subunit
MPTALLPPLAATPAFPWINLVWVLLGIVVLLCLVAAMGRYLAATHPDPEPEPAAIASPLANAAVPSDVAVVIAAAVYAALGDSARVMNVVPKDHLTLRVDNLMLTWSLEGRREIYSSHRVR